MQTELDTKILEILSERVEMLCKIINDPNNFEMSKDWAGAELRHEALPHLKWYLLGDIPKRRTNAINSH